MDERGIEDEIHDCLRREKQNRVVSNGECSLLQCVEYLVEIKAWRIQKFTKALLKKYSSRFKMTLALMHKETPRQENDEGDANYKKRLDMYYVKVISAIATADGRKYTNIYLYAVATIMQVPVYVLMKDENRCLSWFYFPPLFNVNKGELLRSKCRRTYLTLFMHESMSACLPITSNDKNAGPPQATGYIGMQYASLTVNDDGICVPEGIMQRREGLQSNQNELETLIDIDIIHACSEMMLEKGVISQQTANRFGAHRLDNSDKLEFVGELCSSEASFEIFCKFIIRKKNWTILGLLLPDFGVCLEILEDSPELDASYKSLRQAEYSLKSILKKRMTELRTWLGILKEKCQLLLTEDNDEQIVEQFVNSLMNSKGVFCQFCMILLARREQTVLECLGFSKAFISAGTCEYLLKYAALKELERATVNRALRVDMLKQTCHEKSSEIEVRRGRVNWAVIGGSTTGVIGGILATVGLALIPVTAGVSLGLTIAGAVVGAASGIVSGGARGYEAFKQINSVEEIKAIQNDMSKIEMNIQ